LIPPLGKVDGIANACIRDIAKGAAKLDGIRIILIADKTSQFKVAASEI
jgi:hypothetical protein